MTTTRTMSRAGTIEALPAKHGDEPEVLPSRIVRFWLTDDDCIEVGVDVEEGMLTVYGSGRGQRHALAIHPVVTNNLRIGFR